MNNNETLTIKFDTNPSPWHSSLVEITFCKRKIQQIVNDILKACKDKNSYTSAYMYDFDISKILKNHHTDASVSIRPLLQVLYKIIIEQQPLGTQGIWHNEYTAAARSIYTMIAYSTPGFVEAKNYNSMYGS